MSSRYFKFVVGIYFLAVIAGCGNSTPEDASPDLGSATPTSHSPWSPNTSYLVNDTVIYDGQIYINVQATVGSEPPSSDSSHWALVTSSSQASPSVPDENETVQEFSKLTGNDGEIGPPGPPGAPGINWQGPWASNTNYIVSDAVSFDGRSYIAIQATTGLQVPTDTNYWEVLAEKGSDGIVGAQGPIGPVGNDGAQGPAGPAGTDGAQGPAGPAGNDGAQGPAGPAGNDGAQGPVGPAGNDGAQGPVGPTGNDGAQGPVGPAGNDGAQGPAGPAGNDGAQGSVGPAGNDGAQGPAGPAGNDGAQGPAGPAGSDGAQGPAGTEGAQGPAGLTGATGPQGLQGEKGMSWQGTWTSSVIYLVDDVVAYNGSSYINIQETSGTENPDNTSYWEIVAQKGIDGSSGGGGSGDGSSSSGETAYEVAGFSSTQVAGNVGFLGMNTACQSAYGSSARMATTEEVYKTTGSSTASGIGWVRGIAHPGAANIDNTTGFTNGSGASTGLSCQGWSSTSSTGLAISGYNLALQTSSCANTGFVTCSIPAGAEQNFKFAGFSTATVTGSSGYYGMNNACKASFGPDARMANSQEVIESSDVPAQTGTAWLQGLLHPKDAFIDNSSGYAIASDSTLTCKGWSSSSGADHGLSVDGSNFAMSSQFCYISSPVACSVPE